MILIDPSKIPIANGPSELFNDCPIGLEKEAIDILVKYCGIEAVPKKEYDSLQAEMEYVYERIKEIANM